MSLYDLLVGFYSYIGPQQVYLTRNDTSGVVVGKNGPKRHILRRLGHIVSFLKFLSHLFDTNYVLLYI